ncbi:uncharacterized protein LOC127752103, partial [Frankliniella occidentalis]|uniref:Uncharacterized protein LOC127752103 n=1 Tax=Frankliniella occidentalis TaxID=133901 RepID=A0A9C6XCL6_FRAOC
MRYGQLKGLAEDDGVRILQKLSSPELQDMFNRLTCESDLDGARMCLVVRVLAKLCVVEYQPLVASLFCRVCRQEFLNRLLLHIVQLSVLTDDTAATADFYRDFCRLCHGIVKLIPTLAWDKLDNMVRKAASELTQLPPFEGATEIGKDLDLIRAKLAVERERLSKDPQPPSSRSRWRTGGKQSAHHKFRFDDLTPPDDFRMISVYPTVEDISEPGQPYLRRALPRGPYRDANHYLDVHFRLLREDFVRPLREGIVEYCKKMAEMPPDSKKRPRIQNLRIYENVCFNSLLSDDEHVALEVGFDPEGNGLARVNWEYSRRLIRGALLVFARDLSFTSIVLATVSKRDVA